MRIRVFAEQEEASMWRAIRRVFVYLGLMAEKATENDAINEAVVERGIRDSKAKADKAHYANGQLAGQVALLRDQVKRQERQKEELQGMLAAAAAANDADNGAHFAEQLANLEADINDNKAQLQSLEELYQQNTQVIAQSIREIQKFQRDFEQVKVRASISRSLEGLSGMIKGSITEMQGMIGGEMSQSMQQLRQSSVSGEGQMRATMDLARELGSNIQRQQDMRKARGSQLFEEYKKKMGMVQPETAQGAAEPAKETRQKIAER
jgi:phage shock protein A